MFGRVLARGVGALVRRAPVQAQGPAILRSAVTMGVRAAGLRWFGDAAGAVSGAAESKKRLKVLFGTQTGNSEVFARRLMREARKKYGYDVEISDLYEYNPEDLAKEDLVVFVTSSFGEGEPPDNAKGFFEWLRRPHRTGLLENVRYTVFGLGALRSYGNRYQAAPKELDGRLHDLGGQRVFPRGEGNSDGGKYVTCRHTKTELVSSMEEEFQEWSQRFWQTVNKSGTVNDSTGPEPYTCHYVLHSEPKTAATPLRSSQPREGPITAANPFPARVVVNRELHTPLSPRSARHIELEISSARVPYAAGDWVGIVPENSLARVERAARRLEAPLDDVFTLRTDDGHVDAKTELYSRPVTVRDALRYLQDITLPATREAVAAAASAAVTPGAGGEEQLAALQQMAGLSPESKAAFKQFVRNTGRSVIDVLEAFPAIRFDLARFLDVTPPLQHRFYSIASSPLMHPDRIHVSVGVVHDKTPLGYHDGVCSSWLASLTPGDPAAVVPVYVRQSVFRLPADRHVPVVMVAGGVGIAPFRAFLQEQHARRAAGERTNPMHLYFGCRNSQHDWLYREEIEQYLQSGLLTSFRSAFSHEQPDAPLYFVQDRMRETGAELYHWFMQDNASLYVCGNAATVGEGVFHAMRDIFVKHGSMEAEAASEHLRRLQHSGRYLQDVF